MVETLNSIVKSRNQWEYFFYSKLYPLIIPLVFSVIFKELIVVGFLSILNVFIWYFCRRIPKIKKPNIGIVFVLKTCGEKDKQKIKMAFIDEIIKKIQRYENIQVIVLNEYYTNYFHYMNNRRKAIDIIHRRTKASLIFIGTAEIAKDKGQDFYWIKMESSIRHHPVFDNVTKSTIVNQMNIGYPKETLICIDNEISEFKITTEYFKMFSLYLIGQMWLFSHNPPYAYAFHHQTYLEYLNNIRDKKELKVFETNLKKLLHIELCLIAQDYYNRENIPQMGRTLSKAEKYGESKSFYYLKALFTFLYDRNTVEALRYLGKGRKMNKNDYTWAYNKAFLKAYEGKLDEAYHCYNIVFKNLKPSRTITQVCEFIENILKKEPHKYQLHYCLGLIHYFERGDMALAKEEFDLFINENERYPKFDTIIPYVTKYLREIEKRYCNLII